jgi:hypothetical protein
MVFLSTDGATAPVTVGTTSGSTTAEAKIWSGNDEQVDRIDLDFGFNVIWPADGRLYAEHCYIESQRPRLTVHKTHMDDVTTANLNPGAVATLTAVLAELAEGGVRGTTFSVAVTGGVQVDGIDSGAPTGITMTCDGKGGVTIT